MQKDIRKQEMQKQEQTYLKARQEAELASKNIMKQCELLLAIYILKSCSSEEQALSVSEIAEQLNILLPAADSDKAFFPERTLRRKFDILALLESANHDVFDQIFQLFSFVYGGKVVSREADGIASGRNTTGKGKQKRFYFDPVLSEGDMDMICGTVQSSRYLSYEEKDYLLSRLRILFPSYNMSESDINLQKYQHIFQINTLPPRPPKNTASCLPIDTSTFLSHIQTVHDAIENEYQIEIVYGIYDTDTSGKVTFHARNNGKSYMLNPYAMMWNDGDYYMIATHGKYTNPSHFRLDRILSVRPHTLTNPDGTKELVARNPIPDELKPYFHMQRDHAPIFDAITYANTYPEMKIYNRDNRIDCVFECTPMSLQILVDYFGTDIRLKPSPVAHPPVAEQNNPPAAQVVYYAAEVKNVQYDNALGFCVMFSDQLTVLSPQCLIDDLTDKLRNALEKYADL